MTRDEALAARGRWVRHALKNRLLYRVRLVVGDSAFVVDADGRGTCLRVSDLSLSGYVSYYRREWSLVKKHGATESLTGYATRGIETGRTRSDRPNPGYLPHSASVTLDEDSESTGLCRIVAEGSRS